jgi:hypothetical protein
MVAGSRIGPELASAANAASISRVIVWRAPSGGFFSSISLPSVPSSAPAALLPSGLPPTIVEGARSTAISANPAVAKNPRI